MITTFHRPQTLYEALTFLTQPNTVPLGGGTLLSKPTTDSLQAVDLQLLGLDSLTKSGNNLELGATLTLQALLKSEHCPPALKSALKLEAPLNIRNSATVAGTLVACDGRSTLASVMLAMDAKIEQAILDNSRIDYRIWAARFLEKPVDTEEFLLTVAEVLTIGPPKEPPLGQLDFYKGYRERLESKLRHKNNHIGRTERLLESLPEDQKTAYQALLAESIEHRQAIESELDELYRLLEQYR